MLCDATGFKRIIIACGHTDLRCGIDSLASIVQHNFKLDPFEKDVLFLFCGRKRNRIKCLVWEGDGFLLLYKRIENGRYQWPRTEQEAVSITQEQLHMLLSGLSIVSTIKTAQPREII